MNNNWFSKIFHLVFRSGNPTYLYIGLNGFIFLLSLLIGLFSIPLTSFLAMPVLWTNFPERFYTILTYAFLNEGLLNFLFNMLTLYWVGTIFLNFLKSRQFHFVYIAGILMGGVIVLALYAIFPVMAETNGYLSGSSAPMMAVAAAVATLVPDYGLRLFLFGNVRLKYLVIILLLLQLLAVFSAQPAIGVAAIGGAIIGFVYVRALQNGKDLSKIFNKKPHLKVVRNTQTVSPKSEKPRQQEIDNILDKISKSGYDNLTKAEKEQLFRASKS